MISIYYIIYYPNSPYCLYSGFTPGNKSDIMALNNGTSFYVNLGKLQSSIAYNTIISSVSLLSLFNLPAAKIMDFTALIPKS